MIGDSILYQKRLLWPKFHCKIFINQRFSKSILFRTRQCDSYGASGGCKGQKIEWRGCNQQFCTTPMTTTSFVEPSTFGHWTPWTHCSKTCDGGKQTRTRLCKFNSQVKIISKIEKKVFKEYKPIQTWTDFFPTRPSDEYDSAPSRKYSRPLLDVFAFIG